MKKLIIFMMILMLLLSGCSKETVSGADSDRISIVTTVFPLYDFARAVAADKADISMLIKPGAEVHTFDPSPADIIAIQNADIFLYIGGEGDAWVETILSSMEDSDVKAIKMMDYVETVCHDHEGEHKDHGHEHEHEHSHDIDEHIWTSLENAKLMIAAVSDAAGAADNSNAEYYNENAENYNLQIDNIIAEITDIVEESKTKKLIIADRFPFLYFTDEFGLEYISAFDACGSESEASAGVLADLIDEIEDIGAPYIFYAELSNKNIADIIEEQTGAESLELHSCHNVTRDDFENGETYVSIWQRNIEVLRKGLIY